MRFKIQKFFEYVRNDINESFVPNRTREVLFKDGHGKLIVYDDGEYRIAVDDDQDARYITLWFNKDGGGHQWSRVGYLDAWRSEMNFKNRDGVYLSIRSIEIEPRHRNRGMGSKMYRALFDFSLDDVMGVYSYLPNRVNKKQIPSLYRKFGGVVDGDYEFIDFTV
jgi:ribosomal protein S18 acetylase RimI-like enzyme